jgi:hypothetical protein
MASSDFKAAFPKPVKWSTGENRYDNGGKQPRSLTLFVPRESAYAFAQYILNSADDSDRQKTSKIWDYDKKAEVEVEGFYINGKGKEGRDGDFGTINPASTKWLNQGLTESEERVVSGEIPF